MTARTYVWPPPTAPCGYEACTGAIGRPQSRHGIKAIHRCDLCHGLLMVKPLGIISTDAAGRPAIIEWKYEAIPIREVVQFVPPPVAADSPARMMPA